MRKEEGQVASLVHLVDLSFAVPSPAVLVLLCLSFSLCISFHHDAAVHPSHPDAPNTSSNSSLQVTYTDEHGVNERYVDAEGTLELRGHARLSPSAPILASLVHTTV